MEDRLRGVLLACQAAQNEVSAARTSVLGRSGAHRSPGPQTGQIREATGGGSHDCPKTYTSNHLRPYISSRRN